MTDGMVERVAKAIYEAFDRGGKGEYVGDYRFPRGEVGSDTTLDGKWNLDDIARAAIDAMKSPPAKNGSNEVIWIGPWGT
jgi:hypothetical protein